MSCGQERYGVSFPIQLDESSNCGAGDESLQATRMEKPPIGGSPRGELQSEPTI